MPHDMRRNPSQASPPPAPPYYTSSQAPRQTKTDQIVQNFYAKVAQIITQARLIQYDSLSSGNIPPNTNSALNPRQVYQKRPNRWFNLEMWDSDVYKEDLKYWRHTATSTGLPPNPMIIEFFLDTSELPKNKILVITDEIRRNKVDVHNPDENENNKPKNILLESWQLTLSQLLTDSPPDLPIVYKKSIAFFRSLYAYVRLLPAFRLYKRIKSKLNHDLKIGYRFVLPNTDYVDDIGIDVPIIEGETNVSSQFTFGPIDTPLGTLSLKTKYRTNCEFHIDESEEEMISANFMVDYDEQFFTPTVMKYYQEQEQRKQIGKEERRQSVPTRMNMPPSGYLFPGLSPQYNDPLIGGIPRSNPDMNTELTFPKIHAPSSHHLSTFASTLSNDTAQSLPDPRRSVENQLSFRGRYDNISSRPNVTLVQPFKSPSLSSSPSQDNLPSPTFSERSSPLRRSPSSLSLQQRSPRPLSLSGGATLSSSVKSNSSAGSLTKFHTSFSYRHERNSGSNGRESGRESVSSRKRSITNRSDGSGGSFNSSFFASLDDPDDDVNEFFRLVDSREPLKMFSRSPTGPDDSENPGGNMSGSVYKSKQLQLSRFQKYKESHNSLSDSITSVTSQSSPQQLEPPSGLTLGTLSGSDSSSSTISSISKSNTHTPNVPSRLSENVTLDKQGELTTPPSVRMPQIGAEETQGLRSTNSPNLIIPEKEREKEMDNTIKDYSSYSDELVGMRHVDSSSSLSSKNKFNYNQQSQRQHDQLCVISGLIITDGITGAGNIPASGSSSRVEEELLFNLNLNEEGSDVNNSNVIAKPEAINNTFGTTTDNSQDDTQK